VRRWPEVKSRRGAPKRRDTEGFACPNPQCPSFGMTDAHIHALVGDGKHGRLERIPTFRGSVCRTTFTARRHTPLSRLKPPSRAGLPSCGSRAGRRVGCFRSPAGRRAPVRPPAAPGYLARARTLRSSISVASATSTCPTSNWTNGAPGSAAPHRCFGSGWPSILSRAILPVLQLGPRTQHMAHVLIHALRESLAPGCLLLFPSDGLHLSFSALTAHFGQWLQVVCRGRNVRKSARSSGADLRPGEEKLPAAQAGTGHARDAPWNRARSQSRLPGMRLLWTTPYSLY
jgi:hypothetical protein